MQVLVAVKAGVIALTEAQARKLGWELVRGVYAGTTEPRLDRWYWQQIDSKVRDNRGGAGFASKREALQFLAENRGLAPLTAAGMHAWRTAARLSQGRLAMLLGVDVMTVSRWERGERAIPPYLYLALEGLSGKLPVAP